jgi:hypothetical protein
MALIKIGKVQTWSCRGLHSSHVLESSSANHLAHVALAYAALLPLLATLATLTTLVGCCFC